MDPKYVLNFFGGYKLWLNDIWVKWDGVKNVRYCFRIYTIFVRLHLEQKYLYYPNKISAKEKSGTRFKHKFSAKF